MGKKKSKSKSTTFNPPLRAPVNKITQYEALRKQFDKEMIQASNNTFNLVASSMLVAAYDMGMSKEDVKELLARCFGILDDVADNLATIDSIMELVHSWGIEIYRTAAERTNASGKIIEKKTAVFYLLEQGVEEIEEILTKCKQHNIDIDYRDVCAYRWEFNRKKYYDTMEIDMSKKDDIFARLDQGAEKKDIIEEFGVKAGTFDQYKCLWNKERRAAEDMNKNKYRVFNLIERGADVQTLIKELGITEAAAIRYIESYREEKQGGEIEVMTENMKKAFELFDKAYSDAQVVELLKLSKSVVHNYRQEWVRINKRELTSEEMAEILAEETPTDVVILRHKGVLPAKKEVKEDDKPTKKTFIPKSNVEETKQEEKEAVVEQAPTKVEAKREPNNQDVTVLVGSNSKLKKVVKVIAIEGEFTTYKPVGPNSFDMEIDGQVITLSRDQMKEFGSELLAVAEEEI